MAGSNAHKNSAGSLGASVASFGFFAAVSVILMVADHSVRLMEPVRQALSRVSSSAYTMVSMPGVLIDSAETRFRTKAALIEENATMRDLLRVTEITRYKIEQLEQENRSLKQILQQKNDTPATSGLFNVRRVISDGFTQQYLIDGGELNGIKPGMPVLNESGLVGQVLHVGSHTSQVQLIQDKNQAVPVLFEKSGVRAIARGDGEGEPLLCRDTRQGALVQVGEKVITSGLDGVYPRGIPVGVVENVSPGKTSSSLNVSISAPQTLRVSDRVLVLFVNTLSELPGLAEELEHTEQANSPRRRVRRE